MYEGKKTTCEERKWVYGRVLCAELASIHQGGRTRHPEGGKGFDWFTLFNAELPPKRYWLGPKSQKVGEEEDGM